MRDDRSSPALCPHLHADSRAWVGSVTTASGALEQLGWGPDLAAALASRADASLHPGRVVVEHRGRYRVWGPSGQQWAWPPQGMRRKVSSLEKPGVGDWVLLRQGSGGDLAQIVETLPRRSVLTRQAAGERAEPQLVAANLDAVFVVTSMNQDFNLRRLERYLTVVRAGGIQPVIVLNKSDLADPATQDRYRQQAAALAEDVPVVSTSALASVEAQPLSAWLGPGQTVGLVGSSGVGKSSLANALLGIAAQDVGEVRERDDRGRHTTSHRELLLLPEGQGVLVDTPGMRELQLWTGESLEEVFPDVAALLIGRCQFRNCRHNGEPGCAITAAIENGSLSPERWASYCKLREESALQAIKKARLAERMARRPRYRKGSKDRKKKRR